MPIGVVGPLLSPSNQGASFDLDEIENKIEQVNRRVLERTAIEGESPVCGDLIYLAGDQRVVYADTRALSGR